MTVPSGVTSGVLIICGSYWNYELVNFSVPSGTGIVSYKKLHDEHAPNTINMQHIAIYKVDLNPGSTITVTADHKISGIAKIMMLQY